MLRLDDFAAIIFDMDGLVLDTETTYSIAWQQAAKSMNISLPDDLCISLSGLQKIDIDARLLEMYGQDFDLESFTQLSTQHWHEHVQKYGIQTKPGFNELHEFICQQQIPRCLATNSHSSSAYLCLELAGIKNSFQHIVTGDSVGIGKPAPDIFFVAAKCLNVPIEWCLILEDSVTGIEAANASGAFSVYIPSTESFDNRAIDLCDWLMSDLFMLLEALSE